MFVDLCWKIGTTLAVVVTCSSFCTAESRTWVDITGKHKVTAEFVRLADGKVTLNKDGKSITLPLSKLSREDQAFAERAQQGHENSDDEVLANDSKKNDPFAVPDGDAKQLLSFISTLQSFKPPKGSSRQELVEIQTKLLTAMLEASDKVLTGEASKSELESAVQYKMAALSILGRASNADDIVQRIKAFPDQLEALGLKNLAKSASTLVMSHAVARASDPNEGSQAVAQALNHLEAFGNLSRGEIALAQGVGRLAERLGNDAAVGTYNRLGEILKANPKTRPMADIMFGSARRSGLVGNEMEIAGLTSNDKEFDFSQFDGKVVLVDFWATWCGPCMREMPNIRKNYEKYHDRGFEVVAISTDRDMKALNSYLEREQPPWTVLVDKHPKNKKPMSVYYGVSAIPTTILIGPDGNVITLSCRGERLGQELKRLLGEAT